MIAFGIDPDISDRKIRSLKLATEDFFRVIFVGVLPYIRFTKSFQVSFELHVEHDVIVILLLLLLLLLLIIIINSILCHL